MLAEELPDLLKHSSKWLRYLEEDLQKLFGSEIRIVEEALKSVLLATELSAQFLKKCIVSAILFPQM
jgi:hypothetical protein